MKLLVNALFKFALGLILVGALIFIPAGTINYAGGLIFICLLFVPMIALGAVMLIKAPELLKKRLNSKEQRSSQKCVIAFSGVVFLGGFVLAGFDFRFGWSHVPSWCVIAASVVLLASYAAYAEVMRENAYLSRSIEIQQGQKLVSSGLYGIVRHPMYTSTVFLFLTIPIVLGSWVSLACFAFYPLIIVFRIIDEEKLLKNELEGYEEYTKRVKYRLIPFIW